MIDSGCLWKWMTKNQPEYQDCLGNSELVECVCFLRMVQWEMEGAVFPQNGGPKIMEVEDEAYFLRANQSSWVCVVGLWKGGGLLLLLERGDGVMMTMMRMRMRIMTMTTVMIMIHDRPIKSKQILFVWSWMVLDFRVPTIEPINHWLNWRWKTAAHRLIFPSFSLGAMEQGENWEHRMLCEQ